MERAALTLRRLLRIWPGEFRWPGLFDWEKIISLKQSQAAEGWESTQCLDFEM